MPLCHRFSFSSIDPAVLCPLTNVRLPRCSAGHFDRAGTYIFDGRRGLVRDNWLDNVDWVAVKPTKPAAAASAAASSASSQVEGSLDISVTESEKLTPDELYQRIYEMLQPAETVLQVLHRDFLCSLAYSALVHHVRVNNHIRTLLYSRENDQIFNYFVNLFDINITCNIDNIIAKLFLLIFDYNFCDQY